MISYTGESRGGGCLNRKESDLLFAAVVGWVDGSAGGLVERFRVRPLKVRLRDRKTFLKRRTKKNASRSL